MAFVLKLMFEDLESVGSIHHVSSGQEALAWVRIEQPTIAIMDLWLPDIHGVQLARKIKDESPHTHVIVYTGEENIDHYLNDLLEIGISGIVHKGRSMDYVRTSVECVMQGATVLPIEHFTRLRLPTSK